MSDIALRARKYAELIEKERLDAYIFTDVEILVEEAYAQGARDERELSKLKKHYEVDSRTD